MSKAPPRFHYHPLVDLVLRRGLILALIMRSIAREPKYIEQIKEDLAGKGILLSHSSIAQRLITLRVAGLVKKVGKHKSRRGKKGDIFILTSKGHETLSTLIRYLEQILSWLKGGR